VGKSAKFRQLDIGEIAVGKRVQQVRQLERLSQKAFANVLGLSRDQLASIETGRVALPFEVGLRICLACDVNPLWLAVRRPAPIRGCVPYAFSRGEQRGSFRDVITANEHGYDAEWVKRVWGSIEDYPPSEHQFVQLLRSWNISVPKADVPRLRRYVMTVASIFPDVKDYLTIPSPVEIVSDTKSPGFQNWKQLQARLLAATRPRGAKASLSRYLGVDRQLVTEWLKHSVRGPSAETTLRLLDWVTAEEARQTESAGGASTRPAPMTRKSKSTSHEKAKWSRRKN
jgi:transcriptional regulator with XRE-family HTH domain